VAKDALVVPSISGARREVRRVENLHARLAASFPSAILHPLEHALTPHKTRQIRGSTSYRANRLR
jgi:hypothetical protein